MVHYWAQFENRNGDLFRFDTRIYLQPIEKPSKKDLCIGAVIGKNPGSARPMDNDNSTLQPIQLGHDKFLPTVRNIMIEAYNSAGIALQDNPNKYIQVLNLFYLCGKDLKTARAGIHNIQTTPICRSEKNKFNFIFYAWGGPNDGINDYKMRFIRNSRTDNHIWFDNKTKKPKETIPHEDDFVKHTLGLRHKLIIPSVARVIKKLY